MLDERTDVLSGVAPLNAQLRPCDEVEEFLARRGDDVIDRELMIQEEARRDRAAVDALAVGLGGSWEGTPGQAASGGA